ncbi:hypothetical protein OIV83_004008 [Microbotryomycetes sp. JL201]|nr:hypothetical protein OIV83_004008 [Microbotryomycetes sp. JL201]
MAALWQLCCGCLGSGNTYNDHHEVDEHTALLNPDIIPEAPARQPKQTTEEQAAQQEALRKILHKAAERFVNIEAPAPFSQASPFSSRSTSPTRSGPSSPPHRDADHTPERQHAEKRRIASWRPTFNGDETYTDRQQRIKVVHLGPLFDVQGFANAFHGTANDTNSKSRRTTLQSQPSPQRPMSAHSLKTLPRGSTTFKGEVKPSPLRHQGASASVEAEDQDGEESDAEENEENQGAPHDRNGTVTSYKTARENRDSDIVPNETMSADLKKALAELEESVKTFQLEPVGPIVANLGAQQS